MSNNLKDNMYIGYIIFTVLGFSAVGYYFCQSNFFIDNKKQEDGTLQEKENLLKDKGTKIKRKTINDIVYYHNYPSENFQENEKDLEFGLKNNEKNITLEVSEKKNSKEPVLQTIDSKKNNKQNKKDIIIEIQDNQEESPNKEEFDWFVVEEN